MAVIAALAYYKGDLPPEAARILGVDVSQSAVHEAAPGGDVILSDVRAQHILYGDASGGGHKFGVGKPCKSEFPSDWSDEKILSTVKRIAANDNLPWRQEDNGYYVSEYSTEDGTRVRVVLDSERAHVITGYPTNGQRNPCPANDP